MANPQQPVIIIRRKKKGGHEGHHGGAWKVAYADFVTAMMAFFLLLWLLNVTTDTQRRGLADYFAPAGISKSTSGAGGMLAGQSITSTTGAQFSEGTPPNVLEPTIIPTQGEGEEGEEETFGKSKEPAKDAGPGPGGPETAKDISQEEAVMAQKMKEEEARFKQAEEALKKMILEAPGLKELSQHLLVDRTPEGLRIQIIDRDKFSMFPSGGANPYERGQQLLRLVGSVIARLPNHISVTGHTDGTPFPAGSRRDNWGLSTDRANVSRHELMAGGVGAERIARVVGMADRDPLVAGDPKDPRNRRISIVLLRETLNPSPPSKETP